MRISDWSSDVCSSDLEGLALWQRFLDSGGLLRDHPEPPPSDSPAAARDRRFADPAWTEHPFYDLIRQSYLLLPDSLMKLADAVDGVDPKQQAKLRFATTGLLDATPPSNFPLPTQPRRASCTEHMCQPVSILVVPRSFTKNKKRT